MKRLTVTFALAMGIAANAAAQETNSAKAASQKSKRTGGSALQAASPLIKALDSNKDRKIDATELSQAPTALATLDKNKDGQISRDEIQAARAGGARPEPAGPKEASETKNNRTAARSPIVTTLDANKDGTISAQEIAGSPAALKTLDQNKDGELTMDELRGHARRDRPRAENRPHRPSYPR